MHKLGHDKRPRQRLFAVPQQPMRITLLRLVSRWTMIPPRLPHQLNNSSSVSIDCSSASPAESDGARLWKHELLQDYFLGIWLYRVE